MGKGPGGKHDNMRTYSPEEAQRVHQLVQELHPQWTLIAKKVSEEFACERSAASVRNYYKRFQQSQATMLKGMAKNRCQLCNQIKRGHICTPMQATPRTRVGPSFAADENLASTNLGSQSMEVEVVGLAKPLTGPMTPNGYMTLGGMFDDIFPSVAPDEPAPPLPAPATAEPVVVQTIAHREYAYAYPAAAAAAEGAREYAYPPLRMTSCVPTVETGDEEPLDCGLAVATSVVAPSVVAPPPPVITVDEAGERGFFPPPALASASSLLALSASPLQRFGSLPSPEDAAIPA